MKVSYKGFLLVLSNDGVVEIFKGYRANPHYLFGSIAIDQDKDMDKDHTIVLDRAKEIVDAFKSPRSN